MEADTCLADFDRIAIDYPGAPGDVRPKHLGHRSLALYSGCLVFRTEYLPVSSVHPDTHLLQQPGRFVGYLFDSRSADVVDEPVDCPLRMVDCSYEIGTRNGSGGDSDRDDEDDNRCEDGLQGRTSNSSSGPLVRDGPERLPERRGRHMPSGCARFPGRVRAVPDGHDAGTQKTGRTVTASNSASHSSKVDAARTAYKGSHRMSEADRTRTGA